MPRDLDELFDLMNGASDELWRRAGFGFREEGRDVLSLPKFDDLPPDEIMEVYSWDRDRMIVGPLGGPYNIVDRLTHDEEL